MHEASIKQKMLAELRLTDRSCVEAMIVATKQLMAPNPVSASRRDRGSRYLACQCSLSAICCHLMTQRGMWQTAHSTKLLGSRSSSSMRCWRVLSAF